MRNGKYGCALWGCGWVASGHIAAYLKNSDCEFIGLGSRSQTSVMAKIREFGLFDTTVYNSFEELLNDDRVDIVSICTPNDLHAHEAMLAARSGKQIFLEKPVAVNSEELEKLVQTLDEYNTRSVVGLLMRFDPVNQMKRRLIAEGELGDILLCNVDYWFGRERRGWMREGSRSGGAFILGGCHSVDIARYILNSDITAVRGDALCHGDWYDYPPVETAQVRFANGARGVFSCSLTGRVPFTANVHIVGEKGTMLNDRYALERFAEQSGYFSFETRRKQSGDIYDHPFPALVDHFIKCLQEGKDSEHNVRSCINSHKACFAITCSAAADGGWIEL